MNDREPTPADIRALMAEAADLNARIQDAYTRLWSWTDENTRSLTYPLQEAAADVRRARDNLSEAASALARARTARDPKLCNVPWGVCPEHGNTLRSSGGRTWCTASCSRRWDYDRLDSPCTEPVTHQIADQTGAVVQFCHGHTLDARQRLEGAVITPLEPGTGETRHD
ncbi:hypothetical protein [Streptomyces misionensis]|uniref:hypothetical protein n=1 Tax=Streptomyces misionensis TaxID=67331 RepID=UPI0033D38CA0